VTARSEPGTASLATGLAPWAAPALVLADLAGIVLARWAATRAGLDPLGVGAAFGVALAALWAAASRDRSSVVDRPALQITTGRHPRVQPAAAIAPGVAMGAALVGLAIAGAWLGGLQPAPGTLRPAAPFVPWAAVIVLVAAAQEGILRGVLFDRLRSSGGVVLALGVTSVAFALMHVPVYGWGVVPLDLAVGFALGGLRLATGTLLAPITAHAVADLATWWL
jgi:membrane protease YdiL (CAAX protease family)